MITQITQDTRAVLVATRATLALRVEEGDAEAQRALEDVEHELMVLEHGLGLAEERRALAAKARAERSQAETQRAEEDSRKELEARFVALGARRLEAARKVDAVADTFVGALQDLMTVADAMYRTRLALGENKSRLRLHETVAAYVQWRVQPHAPTIGRPDKFYRRPLAAILGGAPSPAPDAQGQREDRQGG
jgi:hypothetical protein